MQSFYIPRASYEAWLAQNSIVKSDLDQLHKGIESAARYAVIGCSLFVFGGGIITNIHTRGQVMPIGLGLAMGVIGAVMTYSNLKLAHAKRQRVKQNDPLIDLHPFVTGWNIENTIEVVAIQRRTALVRRSCLIKQIKNIIDDAECRNHTRIEHRP
jgi:hypothetical protein